MDKITVGKEVLKRLNDKGYEAYFVGGAVRDFLLNRESCDIDIASNAPSEEVLSLFTGKPTGIKYGTVTVTYKNVDFEITRFRYDLEYCDNRHPSVMFAASLDEDLKRRDFTINAMAMDLNDKIFDIFTGQEDLKNRIIRTVGDPNERFIEDSLRILRSIYFSAKLGFRIDNDTSIAIKENRNLISNISLERIIIELKKMVQYPIFGLLSFYGIDFGLTKGISYLEKYSGKVTFDEFIVLCFKLDDKLDEWPFSTKEKQLYSKAVELSLVTEDGNFTPLILYSYGLDICLLANRVNVILGYIDKSEEIKQRYAKLAIHKTCDLKFKGQDIIKLISKPTGDWLSELVDEIKFNVLYGALNNDYDEIKNFVIERLRQENEYK